MKHLSKIRFPRNYYFSYFFSLLLLICVGGCQQRAASKLQGRWEGRPDTAAASAQREAEKFGEVSVGQTGQAEVAATSDAERVTDWEKYPVTILMNFVNGERIEMSLGEGQQPKSGTWKVVSTTPAGCAIEVQTQSEDSEGEGTTVERRRFELLLDERDGTCVGFLLTEAGADRQQGALYFQRPQDSSAAKTN